MASLKLEVVEKEISEASLPHLSATDDIQSLLFDHDFKVPVRRCSHYLLVKERWHWENFIRQVVRDNNDIIDVDNLRLTHELSGYTKTEAYEDTGIVGGVILASVDFSLSSITTAVFGPVISAISITSRLFGLKSRKKLEKRLLGIKEKIGPVHKRHQKVKIETFKRFDRVTGYDPHKGA